MRRKRKRKKRKGGEEIKTSILGEGERERIQNNSTTPTKNNIPLFHHTHQTSPFFRKEFLIIFLLFTPPTKLFRFFEKNSSSTSHISGRRGRGGRRGRERRGRRGRSCQDKKKQQENLWERKRIKNAQKSPKRSFFFFSFVSFFASLPYPLSFLPTFFAALFFTNNPFLPPRLSTLPPFPLSFINALLLPTFLPAPPPLSLIQRPPTTLFFSPHPPF